MIEIQTIRRGNNRQIIKIKGILSKEKLPAEYISNKSGQRCAIWGAEYHDGKKVLVLRGHGKPLALATMLPGESEISEGDSVPENVFQELIDFMNCAGYRLHNININKKLGMGIKETVRI